MNLILFTDMLLLMTVCSDIIVLIFPYIGLKYHIECVMEVMKYLPLANNSPGSNTFPSMVLTYWRVYGNSTL